MTNKLLKIAAIFLCMAALSFSCQEDYDTSPAYSDSGGARHRIITGTEAVKKREDLMADLKSNGGKGMQNLRNKIVPGAARFSYEHAMRMLDSTEVYEVFDNETGKTNLTFRVANEYANDTLFYNLVVQRGIGVKITLIEYDMDPIFARQYAEGISGLERFTGTMTFTALAVDGAPCGDVPPGGIAIVGGNGPRAPGGELASVTVPPHGSNYSQTLMLAQYIGLSISSGNSNGNNNNNSGTGDSDDGIIHDDEVSHSPRYFKVPPSIEDPSDPCGGGDEVGILGPNDRSDNDNCENLKSKETNTDFRANMQDLKTKSVNQNFESAYILYDTPGQGLNFSPEMTGTTTLPEVTFNLTQTSTQSYLNTVAILHCHLENTTTFKVFSFTDIITFSQLASISTKSTKELAIYVTTNSGGTYALKINNRASLVSYLNILQYGQLGFEQKFNKYVKTNQTIDDQITGLLNFIETEFPREPLGIDLYRQQSSGSWEKLTLNQNKKNFKAKKC